jgi:hypothetical protein
LIALLHHKVNSLHDGNHVNLLALIPASSFIKTRQGVCRTINFCSIVVPFVDGSTGIYHRLLRVQVPSIGNLDRWQTKADNFRHASTTAQIQQTKAVWTLWQSFNDEGGSRYMPNN